MKINLIALLRRIFRHKGFSIHFFNPPKTKIKVLTRPKNHKLRKYKVRAMLICSYKDMSKYSNFCNQPLNRKSLIIKRSKML